MKSQAIINPEKIHLENVDILKARINSEFEAWSDEADEFQFSVSYNNGFNLQEKRVRCELEINVNKLSIEKKTIAESSFTISYVYRIEDFDTFVEEKEGGIVFNVAMAATLAGISFSTGRGILLTRFQGTIFKDFILPVIDPKKMLDDKIVQH